MPKIGYFDTKEFASKDGKDSPWPTVVNPQLIELCNKIREAYGRPIVVNSGYRSPEHNEKIGGVKNSMHVLGQAADLAPLKRDKDWLPFLHQLALNLNHNGGVGLYDTFVHVDTRGEKARWDNRTA